MRQELDQSRQEVGQRAEYGIWQSSFWALIVSSTDSPQAEFWDSQSWWEE